MKQNPCPHVSYRHDKNSKLESIRVEIIPPTSLYSLVFGFFQLAPRKVSKRFPIVRIPREDVIHIPFPQEIGSYRDFKRIINKVNQLGDLEPINSIYSELNELRKQGFDFSKFIESKELNLARATSALGWDGRNMWDKRCLEYYIVYRYLKFEKTKAILRTNIINVLKDAVHRMGTKLSHDIKLEVAGLISAEQIDEMIARVENGEIGFEEAINTISKFYL